MKKTATQFNCQKGDAVVVVRRKRGRSLRETLTIVSIGIENEHGHPMDFMAADEKGKAFKLSPFEDSDALRVVILPKEVPAELARYKDHPEFVVARMPGCDRFTYRLVSRKNLEPVCRIRVERQAQDILFSDGVWWARDEEVVSATEFFSAGGKRITLKGLIIESCRFAAIKSMSLCLNDALEIQAHLRQRRLAAQGKSVSPDLQAVLERFPELQKLLGQFAADAGSPLEISSAPENRMIAVRILHARSLPPNRSAFPDARQVTLLILGNATTFYFLAELGSGGSDINHAVQGSYLLTPETTLLNRLPNNETCEGPHIVVAERSLPWVIENFEALRAARHIAVRSWNQALSSLEKGILGSRTDHHMELYHTPVRQLLSRFPVLVEHQDAEYLFRGREDLDKPLVDCIPPAKVKEQPFRPRDLDHSVTRYHKTARNPVFLKKMGLPANVEHRLRQRMQDVKDALQHCRLTEARWPGFCEIADVVPLNAKQSLLLDENGFSVVWNIAAPLTADDLKTQYCVPAAQMHFPPEIWSTCCHLLPKAEVQALMEVSGEDDPFGLAAGFLAYLRRGTQSCGNHEPANNIWFANLCFYLTHRMAPLWSPTREEIIALAQRGRPPYRVRDALECIRPEQARYSFLDQKDPPLNLLQRQANCAASIRALSRNAEFLDWKLIKS